MKFALSSDEVRIIASAINWSISVTFTRINAPEFSEPQKERLQTIFDELCRELHQTNITWSATLDNNSLVVRDRTVAVGSSETQSLRDCLDACYAEIGHSATEVSAVTGLPITLYSSLLDRVSKLGDEADLTANE